MLKLKTSCGSLVLAVVAVIYGGAGCSRVSSNGDQLPDKIAFNRDVRPILSNKCFSCHGPDSASREAGLRLDSRESVLAERDGYSKPAIVPGSPRKSALVERITHSEPEKRMPPVKMTRAGSGGEPLTDREVAVLIRWIEQGAAWEEHWAYGKIVRPRVPQTKAALVHPIDRFIVAKLEESALELSPTAARPTLLRRLSLDLNGLPPAPSELDEFLLAPEEDAYQRAVERLLSSPHYGERLAILWLDLVRYADTNGYHSDVHRRIWPYRDYVINAFNENKPFDLFTREQLAGDLFPDATREQLVASGFNRLGQATKEGGSQPKEFLAKYAADRVRTVATTWLGSTMACAECHDHKFDPFTIHDFYSLTAFFADVKEVGLFLNDPNLPPELPLLDLDPVRAAGELGRLDRLERLVRRLTKEKEKKQEEKDEDNTRKEADSEAINKQLKEAQRSLEGLIEKVPKTLVTVSVEPRLVRVLPRGNWQDDSGEIVLPDVPRFLPPLSAHRRRATRLDLADWLVSPENPLTARVFVNRLWAHFFGYGICRTVSDVGSQGDWPTHPELLDWLAAEFIESGWDVKHMVRLIVTSATYRQRSHSSQLLREKDPDNRMFARQNRFRLVAEVVRDNALAASGLLASTVGGPSVKPYQPGDYWSDIQTFGVDGPGSTWVPSTGEDQYRRGLYTYWKRSFLHPSLQAFDAPDRQECTTARTISNTPLQALALLNDPSYVEAARVFAMNLLSTVDGPFRERANWVFKRALARRPRPEEISELEQLHLRQLGYFKDNLAAAKELISIGQYPVSGKQDPVELAAWTSVTRVVLNLHETITRY